MSSFADLPLPPEQRPACHSNALRIAMVAGEASGDLLAALLLRGLRSHGQTVRSMGIGAAAMRAEGFEAVFDSERLAVHGYSLQVLLRVAGILRIRSALRQRLLRERPDVFIGVDAPDFNLGLERDLRRSGIKTVHFVCPSIWAWRFERIHTLAAAADHVLCLFPFEPALLHRHGVPATYVGHPLAAHIPLEIDRALARAELAWGDKQDFATAPIVAVLPGSRGGEVRYNTPPFLQAAAQLLRRHARLRVLIPAVPAQHQRLQAAIAQYIPAALLPRVRLLQGQSHTALAACDCTLIASGTATLEAALFKRPMVISYHLHPWSWALMRRKQLQPWVGLPNILSQDFVVPELLQDAGHPSALADAVQAWLEPTAAPRVHALQQRFTQLHHDLRRDTAALAAHVIEELYASRS